MKRIIVSVTNDISTDQRVQKVCNTLVNNDFEIYLIGRRLPDSLALNLPYKTFRFKLIFNKGFLFYAEYNARLFFKLLFLKKEILLANDLDTLLPNFLVSKIFNKKLVYDSHELFTEVPELINRPKVQRIWLKIERWIFPKLKNIYTVNNEIASIYSKKYNVNVNVIRNIAKKHKSLTIDDSFTKKIKGSNKMLILQGSGINIDRGAEEAVEMMQYLKNVILYIIGSGDVFEILKNKISSLNLASKVILKDKMPYLELMKYTQIADLGLSLDKNTNLNYTLSLPNKVFDYLQAGAPILSSNTKVVSKLILENNIGFVTNTHNPKELAEIVKNIFDNKNSYIKCKNKLTELKETFHWENEEKKLIEIYSNLE